jgi:hypothetical protein
MRSYYYDDACVIRRERKKLQFTFISAIGLKPDPLIVRYFVADMSLKSDYRMRNPINGYASEEKRCRSFGAAGESCLQASMLPRS